MLNEPELTDKGSLKQLVWVNKPLPEKTSMPYVTWFLQHTCCHDMKSSCPCTHHEGMNIKEDGHDCSPTDTK